MAVAWLLLLPQLFRAYREVTFKILATTPVTADDPQLEASNWQSEKDARRITLAFWGAGGAPVVRRWTPDDALIFDFGHDARVLHVSPVHFDLKPTTSRKAQRANEQLRKRLTSEAFVDEATRKVVVKPPSRILIPPTSLIRPVHFSVVINGEVSSITLRPQIPGIKRGLALRAGAKITPLLVIMSSFTYLFYVTTVFMLLIETSWVFFKISYLLNDHDAVLHDIVIGVGVLTLVLLAIQTIVRKRVFSGSAQLS